MQKEYQSVDSFVFSRATAALEASVKEDLEQEDTDIEDLLTKHEDTD